MTRKKVFTIMWSSYLPLLKEAADTLSLDLLAYSTKQMNLQAESLLNALQDMERSDLILLYRTNDAFWEELTETLNRLGKRIPIVAVGSDPSLWSDSTVHPEVAAAVYRYLLYNGPSNIRHLFRFLKHHVFGDVLTFEAPEAIPWQGIHHPDMEGFHLTTESYLEQYAKRFPSVPDAYVGLLYPRSNWATGNLALERRLIASLEARGIGVIPVFLYSLKDDHLENMSGAEAIRHFLMKEDRSRVSGIIKMTAFFLDSSRGEMKSAEAAHGASLMQSLNVPLFGPTISYYKNQEEWLHDPQGLGAQAAWSIAMPEFEGVIEPLAIGATRGIDRPEEESYEPIAERIERLSDRVARWIRLQRKPNGEKKVAFILHNNPCVSVEGTVGAGAHLDTLESVADLLKRLAAEGYAVTPPADGRDLIRQIMDRKAVSEFRWTTVEEIVKKGGYLDLVETARYAPWFDALPEQTRRRMCDAWGNPPGEEKDGVPAAMVYDGKIVITGISYGNAAVLVQPKRGCAGARCDGRVCKILHDPDTPPPHQYVATYLWLSRVFDADAVIHVGTHGNLEFLPGKGTGLSSGCFPDIGIDAMPHLYIYNADNPPEGTTAKRRTNAVLVDHLQTTMVRCALYGDLEQVERLIDDYGRFKDIEPARAHAIAHMIEERIKGMGLFDGSEHAGHDHFHERAREIHDRLALFKNTAIPKGMHVFGRLPEGEKLADFIYAMARYENVPDSLRGVLTRILSRETSFTADALEEETEKEALSVCRAYVLHDESPVEHVAGRYSVHDEEKRSLEDVGRKLDAMRRSVWASDETASLLNGLQGGYIAPGPSGLITRGRSDVLPTGRNFYSLDPQRIPSPSAWETGKILADKTLKKYRADTGRFPENIAFYWQCTDIMWSDGEGMSQMMYLLGVRPLWRTNGRLNGFAVIPLEELGRPRIDITVRVSGIARDNFSSCMAVLDAAVQAVAALDESPDMNFVRKHTEEKLSGNAASSADEFRRATYRIFASMPGTYQAGTQLAVYASAWKTQQDLSDVFLSWNGYAYGQGSFGEPAHEGLKSSLMSVELSFNRSLTDEYDLTGCCSHFGTHGGLINAARVISGRDIKNYYGDTREAGKPTVRTLAEEIRRIARAKILNPVWIDGMKDHGYKGAGEISKRVGRLYGWQATARAVDDAVFDDVVRTFMMDEENRKFFEANNPWAMEEMARRLMEAAERNIWNPAPDIYAALKDLYVEFEGWIEEKMEDAKGDFQGGAVNIVSREDVPTWKHKMEELFK